MTTHEWILPDDYPRCLWAEVFYRTARDSIFTHSIEHMPPELVDQLHERLLQLRNELLARLTLFHYAAASGPPHHCVDDLYLQAVNRLHLLSLTMQAPKPAQPEQRHAPLTPEQVLDIFEKNLPSDTFIGEERDEGEPE